MRVEPGIVLDELNAELQPHGLRFAPDISTASRATIGGMIANNSCGARSVIYGKTIDHVLELKVVLADGSVAQLRTADADELEAASARRGPRGTVLSHRPPSGRRARRRDRAPLPEDPAPRRRLQPRRIRPARAARSTWPSCIVGSEGTLGVVLEAKLNLVRAAEGQGGAGRPVRRPARSAGGHAGHPASIARPRSR